MNETNREAVEAWRGEQRAETDNPIFVLREVVPDGFGHAYRIWADGRIEGFEGRYVISNGIAPLANLAKGLAIKARDGGLITAEQAASILA